ncbi:DUF5403 family protein [Corynebacterium resistens]|uniref:DUF5403 family protein n=1 Tax=Corynebacterium resistens TaxID=258224 RepID=UPI0023566DAE|nr:DUF5403 family protein [Corynebacterium resistens]
MATVHKGAGVIVAKMAGRHPVMDGAAKKIQAKALALAAADRKTGEYSSNFKVAKVPSRAGKGVVDRVVYNDHPKAVAIELGHFTPKGKLVPGRFYLHRAARGH